MLATASLNRSLLAAMAGYALALLSIVLLAHRRKLRRRGQL
jgi:hypothetical protein